MKTLYFEGAGMFEAEAGVATGVGNCRIRTVFRLDDGQAVYLEIIGGQRTKYTSWLPWEYAGWVDSCHYITDDPHADDENSNRIPIKKGRSPFEYSKAEILKFVNELGASFEAIEVVPFLGGYRVFSDIRRPASKMDRYNFGDQFQYDPEMTARREAVRQRVYDQELQERIEDRQRPRHERKMVHSPGSSNYPNFSLWVDGIDAGMLHLLRHYNGYNKHWTIRTDTGDCLEDWMSTMTEAPLGRYGC